MGKKEGFKGGLYPLEVDEEFVEKNHNGLINKDTYTEKRKFPPPLC
jgi:hypothetical protein